MTGYTSLAPGTLIDLLLVGALIFFGILTFLLWKDIHES